MELRMLREDDELTHVALVGRLDLAGVQEIEVPFTAHTATRRKPTLVDLSQVTFVVSLGLRMLMGVAKALSLHGAKMVLLKPQPPVEATLKVVAFHHLMPIEHDSVRALDRLKTG
jgi:anti-anti-sigma factor